MTWKEYLKMLFGAMNLTDDQKKVADEKITTLPEPEVVPPAGGNTTPEMQRLQARLEASDAKVEQLTKMMADEIAGRKSATEALNADNEKKKEAEIKALLDTAVAEGKFPADSAERRQIWERQFKADFDGAKVLLAGVPSTKTVNQESTKPGNTSGAAVKGVNPSTSIETLRENAAAAFGS